MAITPGYTFKDGEDWMAKKANLAITGITGVTTDWANPGTIGSTTPNTGAFTTLTSKVSTATNPVGIGVDSSATNYGLITFNNVYNSSTGLGFAGGGGTDKNLYAFTDAGAAFAINHGGGTNSATMRDSGCSFKGTNTNNNASAGYIGEYVESVLSSVSEITLTAGTPTNITSISLTAGDWDVWGVGLYESNATTTATSINAWLSSTSATIPSINLCVRGVWQQISALVPNGGYLSVDAPKQRFILSATTTVYLSTQVNFGVANMFAFGAIRARRRR